MQGFIKHTQYVLFVVSCWLFINANAQSPLSKIDPFVHTATPDSLEKLLKTLPPSTQRIDVLVLLARNYFGQPEKIAAMLGEIKTLSKKFNYNKGLADYDYVQGILVYVKKDYATADKLWQQAYQKYTIAKDTFAMIRVLHKLGELHNGYTFQLENLHTAQNAYYFERANDLAIKINNPYCKIVTIAAIGPIKYNKAQPDSAALCYRQVIVLSKQFSIINPTVANCYANLVKIYQDKKQYSHALDLFLTVEVMLEKFGMTESLIVTRQNVAAIHENTGNYVKAEAILKKSLPFFENGQFVELAQGQYTILANIAEKTKNYPQSIAYHKLYEAAKDSLNNNQNIAKYREYEVQYGVEKTALENKLLTQQKTTAEWRNKLFTMAGLIAATMIAALLFLFVRLQKTNRKLKTASVEIERLVKTREHFFGIIAHDLRRPLHAFQGMSELINHYTKANDFVALAKISTAIDQSGKKIEQLLNNLLTWALSQKEEIPYQPQTIVLLPKLQEIVSLFEQLHFKNAPQFIIECHSTLTLYADPNALDLIIRNFIDNAVKALPQNGTIKITAQAPPNPSDRGEFLSATLAPPSGAGGASFTITDTGHGMSTQQLATVRSVFADPNQAHAGDKGMGLGLIMIGRFVKRNGGTIEVESKENEGTTFTVRLPVGNG